MARNVEIKARVREPAVLRERALALGDGGEAVLRQEDRFFQVQQGRLKLRVVNGQGELIYYRRPDQTGAKLSEYQVLPVAEAAALGGLLESALGSCGVVRKERRLVMVGQTRIHLDDVEGLGHFVELEVVLTEGESEAHGRAVADSLMERLGIVSDDLVPTAYVDLLDSNSS